MELFVYSWFYTGSNVYGHSLDADGKYRLLRVRGFHPLCYVDGDTVPRSSVTPIRAEYVRMATSRDVSSKAPFCRLYFDNSKDMEAFFSDAHVRRYMADIPQITVFLSQTGADHVGWVRVPNQDCDICDVIPLPDKIPYSRPRIIAFDIEVRSSDSGMPQPHRIADTVEMISAVVFESGSTDYRAYVLHKLGEPVGCKDAEELIYDDEIGVINGFFELLKREDATVITGFNIYSFDIHYLISRLRLRLRKIPDVSRGIRGSVDILKVDWASDAYGHNQFDRLVIGGRLIIDMFLYFRRMKLDRYSLDSVSKRFLGYGKRDMPASRMMAAFGSGDVRVLKDVAEYCLHDSVLVMRLFERVQMWIDLCEVSKITRCGIEDIYTRGEQMKLISQCVRECISRDIVLQPQVSPTWRDYEGAYVIDPERGLYDGCCTLDFQSLYPSIIIAFNICPSTYCSTNANSLPVNAIGDHRFRKNPVGLLPGMIRSILDERRAVKKTMEGCRKGAIEYTVLDRRQNALKICANSVYGMMGFKNSRYFGHVGCAESVTTIGREILSRIVEHIETEHQVRVIYGDTDSCMLWVPGSKASRDDMEPLGRAICDEVTEMLPEPMALKFESYYDKVVLLTKKRYILIDGNKVSYKGVINARRDYCRFAKDTYEGVIGLVVAGQSNDSIRGYVDNRMHMLLMGMCCLEDLIITKSLSKKLSAYKVNQPHVVFARRLTSTSGTEVKAGTRLEYVYVKTGDRIVTPEEARLGELPIDGSFYIKKQVASQVDEVLDVVGMGCYIRDTWFPICDYLYPYLQLCCTTNH